MAITTLDGVLNGLRPARIFAKPASAIPQTVRFHSFWGLGGSPGVGASSVAGLNGAVLSSSSAQVAGQLDHRNPDSGNAYIAKFIVRSVSRSGIWVFDRLWHNNGLVVTSTASQAIATPTWPSRCPTSGLDDTPSTNGHGVHLFLELSGATGAGAPNITVGYTNSAGVAGRVGNCAVTVISNGTVHSCYPITLQGTDEGVRSVESFQMDASMTSGSIRLVAARPLLMCHGLPQDLTVGGVTSVDPITGGFPRLYDGAVPYLMINCASAAQSLAGEYQTAVG